MNIEQYIKYVRSLGKASRNIRDERVRAEETRREGILRKEAIKKRVGQDISVKEQQEKKPGGLVLETERRLRMSKKDREIFERGLKKGTWKSQIQERKPERSSPKGYSGRRSKIAYSPSPSPRFEPGRPVAPPPLLRSKYVR